MVERSPLNTHSDHFVEDEIVTKREGWEDPDREIVRGMIDDILTVGTAVQDTGAMQDRIYTLLRKATVRAHTTKPFNMRAKGISMHPPPLNTLHHYRIRTIKG